MSLGNALHIAVSGLTASQAQIDLISQNVANQGSVGYIRRRLEPTQLVVGDRTGGVLATNVTRIFDTLVQRQLRTENAGASYTDTTKTYATQLDQLFGSPGGDSSLDTLFNNFTSKAQALAADPASTTSRSNLVDSAGRIATALNDASDDIQNFRGNAETGLASAARQANDSLDTIVRISREIAATTPDQTSPALLDERDRAIDTLSSLADVRVNQIDGNNINIITNSGVVIYNGSSTLKFQFDERSNLTPQSLYNVNPALSGVGQLTLVSEAGAKIDVVQEGVFRSGKIKALLELRDDRLVQAQNQIDDLAEGLATALSDVHPTPVAATAGAQTGYDIDLAGLQPGNKVAIDYTVQPSGAKGRVTIIRVDNPAALPLPANPSGNPTDIIVAADFSGGVAGALASIQSQLTAAGTNISVANPSGQTLRVLDDGAANTRDIDKVDAGVTQTGLTGNVALPFFTDGAKIYSGSFESGRQKTGFAQRIAVNPAIQANKSTLVVYSTAPATLQGDPARPNWITDQLQHATVRFSSDAGLGGSGAAFDTTVGVFARRIIEDQGAKSSQAQSIDAGQQVVVNSLKQKFSESAGVNVDTELADLVKIQNAYSANARVITTVKDLLDLLLRI